MLKLFRRGCGELDPVEQDTRVYVRGAVGVLRGSIEEWNRKEDAILFYLGKHLRYADAFAREEHRRRTEGLAFKIPGRPWGTPDERIVWQKRLWYRLPLFARPFLYFVYRYFLLLGFLDGANGFLFHFLQAFWFRLVVDTRLRELTSAGEAKPAEAVLASGETSGETQERPRGSTRSRLRLHADPPAAAVPRAFVPESRGTVTARQAWRVPPQACEGRRRFVRRGGAG